MEYKSTFTIPSARIYMDELSSAERDMVRLTFFRYNRMKEWYYNQSYNEKYLEIPFTMDGKTETALLKEHYRMLYGGKLSDYYVTSLFSSVNGMRRSQRELLKLAEQERIQRQENRREKADSLKEHLVRMQAGKDWLKAFGRYLAGKGTEPKAPSVQEQGFTYSGRKLFHRGKNSQLVKEDPFVYERELEKRIRQTKARIAQIEDKIRRTDEKAGRIPSRITFGSKKQYKKKDTLSLTGKALEAWHQERDFARNRIVNFSGRAVSPDGNYLCKYDPEKQTLEATMINGKKILFQKIRFPYRGEELAQYLKERKGSVGYMMERKKDGNGREYLIFKAALTVKKDNLNYSTSDGVLAYDFNYDHIAWADVSSDGNLIKAGVIPFTLDGLSSGHAKEILGTAVKKLVALATDRRKPIVREDLDFVRKKAQMEYRERKQNQKLSALIYSKATAMVEARAFREDTVVLKVNPAYTSLIAKVKYMKLKNLSIHCAAAYVIGRRGMGLSEKLPSYLNCLVPKTQKNRWRTVFTHAKKAGPSYFRENLPVWDKWKQFDTDVHNYNENYFLWKESYSISMQ